MRDPFENYEKLVGQLQMVPMFLALGTKEWHQVLEGAEQDSGIPIPEHLQDQIKKAPQFHLRMSLVYGVVLLEAMIKDYALYLYDETSPRGKLLPQSAQGHPPPAIMDKPENSLKLPLAAWKHRVRTWAKEAIVGRGSNSHSNAKYEHVVDGLTERCADFQDWRVLLKSYIIRNLEVHNDGLMNARNHRRVPLCPVGEKPCWDRALVVDLMTLLDCLNKHLGGFNVLEP